MTGMLTSDDLELIFGSLDMFGRDHSAGWWLETQGSAAGTGWGNPQPVERTILAFLLDGSSVIRDSDDNREMPLIVHVHGEDAYALAMAEKALMAECGRRNVLQWIPPNPITGTGPACVFDVVTSKLEFAFSEMNERFLKRVYTLTITALPFARPPDPVPFSWSANPTITLNTVTIDDCSAITADWSTHSSSFTDLGSSLKIERIKLATENFASYGDIVTRSGLSVNMSTTPFLRLDFSTYVSGGAQFQKVEVYLNGILTPPVSSNGTVSWYISPPTLNSVEVEAYAKMTVTGQKYGIILNDISRSNSSADSAGGDRQTFHIVAVRGAARTQGVLAIADPTVALGSVLVYTTPDSTSLQQPPLRRLRTSGPTETADTSLVSGKSSDLGTNHVFQIPARNLTPGLYILMARVKGATSTSYTLSWAAKSVVGATTVDASQSGTQSVTLSAGVWTVVTLARMILPSAVMGTNGIAQIELSGPSGLLLDEAWAFNKDTGRLIHVECGTAAPAAGGAANRVFIDAPTLDSPVPSLTIGTAADRSDAFNPGTAIKSFDQPVMEPDAMSVFLVTTNSIAATGSGSYFPRYHTHVADDS